jgi:hypothetical protein
MERDDIWLTLTCQYSDEDGELAGGEPVSAPVLAKAVIRLFRTAKFLPSPAEFCAAMRVERESIEWLLDGTIENSLVWLVTKKPPTPPVDFRAGRRQYQLADDERHLVSHQAGDEVNIARQAVELAHDDGAPTLAGCGNSGSPPEQLRA